MDHFQISKKHFQRRKRNKNRIRKRVQLDHSAVRDVAIPPKIKNKGIRRPLQPNRQQQPSTSIMPPIDLTIDSPEKEQPKPSNKSTSKVTRKGKPKNNAPYSKQIVVLQFRKIRSVFQDEGFISKLISAFQWNRRVQIRFESFEVSLPANPAGKISKKNYKKSPDLTELFRSCQDKKENFSMMRSS